MSNIFIRIFPVAMAACMINACTNDSGEHIHPEVEELRTEVEQLTNAVGRLEFRIYELENYHPGTVPGDSPDAPPDPAEPTGAPTQQPGTNGGRYDITPVE